MQLADILAFSQIGFYVVAGTVAVLTYLKAKNGLLNTINTEYHKRLIDRLASLTEELYAEFDHDSENHWSKRKDTSEFVSRLNEELLHHKEDILSGKKDVGYGLPMVSTTMKYWNLAAKYKSDPFIPPKIRELVVNFLDERKDAELESYRATAEYYVETLRNPARWTDLGSNEGWLHNKFLDEMRTRKFGIDDSEARVNRIRDAVRDYFQKFDSLRISR